jgi:hypothetical protein
MMLAPFHGGTQPLEAPFHLYSMMSWPLEASTPHVNFWRDVLMYLCYIFMIEAILGTNHDLSNLYHGYFMFEGILRVYSSRVVSYKEANAPHSSNHNSHL